MSGWMVLVTLAAAAADRQPQEPPPIFRAVLECRALADDAARLACYDRTLATIATAQQKGEVVIADQAQVRESKRALFGYTGVRIPLLGGDTGDLPSEIEATLTGLRSLGYGKWEFTLDNGMRWRQTDDEQVDPRVGRKVVVKRAAMGSYLLKAGVRAVRVMRIQ